MSRSFEWSLRPKVVMPSSSLVAENLWSLDAALELAARNTRIVRVGRQRRATLYLNAAVEISRNDLAAIEAVVGDDHAPDNETRSVWLDVSAPFRTPLGEAIETVQVKGVVFDSARPMRNYGGAGWPREIYFADRDGRIRRYDAPQEGAVGYCFLTEAVNEYLMCLEAARRLAGTSVHVPLAVGWGRFENVSFGGHDFGFVVLGLPALVPGRHAPYVDSAERLAEEGDFGPMNRLLRLRAGAIGAMNRRGFVVPGRHFGNMSLTSGGEAFMHDLGPPHSLPREQFFSDEQFAAEAFAQLAYAMTPRKVLVPVPPPGTAARRVAIDYLDEYTTATLRAYYGEHSPGAESAFEDVEEAFFAALESPLQDVELPAARAHCAAVGSWLAVLRAGSPV